MLGEQYFFLFEMWYLKWIVPVLLFSLRRLAAFKQFHVPTELNASSAINYSNSDWFFALSACGNTHR